MRPLGKRQRSALEFLRGRWQCHLDSFIREFQPGVARSLQARGLVIIRPFGTLVTLTPEGRKAAEALTSGPGPATL